MRKAKNIYDSFNDTVDNNDGMMPEWFYHNGKLYDVYNELASDKRSLSIFAECANEKIKLETIGYSGEKLFTYS
jgi:hypothetical protein